MFILLLNIDSNQLMSICICQLAKFNVHEETKHWPKLKFPIFTGIDTDLISGRVWWLFQVCKCIVYSVYPILLSFFVRITTHYTYLLSFSEKVYKQQSEWKVVVAAL